ncbi:MAG: hypothetical protein IKA11_01775 [Clostridia bacterium]|nr:hypothetical protein [Clostridia bacterium]
MKKSINKILSAILVFAAALCFILAVAIRVPTVKASATAFDIKPSAEIYQGTPNNDDTGIRFTAQMDQQAYNDIISSANGSTVFFGIQLSVNGNSPLNICYTASDITGQKGFNKVTFETEKADEIYSYTATIKYDVEILTRELALDKNYFSGYDESKSEEDNIAAFKESGLLEKYLQAAYKSEITAVAYYQVGTTEASLNEGPNTLTRSMWGVGSNTYAQADKNDDSLFDENGEFLLVGKYFTSATDAENVEIDEYGTITGYEVQATDKVYLNAVPVTVTNNKLTDTTALEGLIEGDILPICVVTAENALINLNAKFDMLAELITTEAVYDATAQKIYYETESGPVSIDATNALYVDGETEYTIVKNQYLFNKKDAITFRTDAHHIDDMNYLNADLMVEGLSDPLQVAIAYDVATANYTGVTIKVKNAEGNVAFSFTDVVLATAVIDTGAELKEIFNKADTKVSYNIPYVGNIAKGVFMLMDDIDAKATGFTFTNSYFNFFDGLLDGRGHNIINLDVSSTDKPGNGLFSAISSGSLIQNIGFVDVVANNGSVFQGNLAESHSNSQWLQTYGIHWGYNYSDKVAQNSGRGFPEYRAQLGIPTSDITSLMSEYLSNVYRAGNGQGGAVYSNVFVRVAPTTTQFRGVISRNMVNSKNQVRAYNLVIEYQPSDAILETYGNYTQSGYGVLFGGAYTLTTTETIENGDTTTKTWFTPGGVDIYLDYNNVIGSLNYIQSCLRANGYRTKVYVISKMGLVSCVSGQILDTNDTTDATNLYKFFTQKDSAGAESGHIETYAKYEDIAAVGRNLYNTNSFMGDTVSFYKFWNFSNNYDKPGYMSWKNLPTEQA